MIKTETSYYQLVINNNETLKRVFTIGQPPIPLNGYSVFMNGKENYDSTTNLFQWSLDNYLSIIPGEGKIILNIPYSIVYNFTFTSGVYDIVLFDGYGNASKIIEGDFVVRKGITKL